MISTSCSAAKTKSKFTSKPTPQDINKKHIYGDIEINADLIGRGDKLQNCFYFGYYLEDECGLDFANMEILYPAEVGDNSALHDRTKDKDEIYLKDSYNAARMLKGELPLGLNFPAIVAREDNTLVLKFTGKNGKALPRNIWYNTNARFALKGQDFTIEYSNDNKEAVMTIPYFVVRDSGFLQLNPDEEA